MVNGKHSLRFDHFVVIRFYLEPGRAIEMRDNPTTGCFVASEPALGVVTDLAGGAVVNVLAAFVNVDAVDKEVFET